MFVKASEYLTQQLENENVISHDKRELYKYGFQNGMILTLNFFTSILIGVIFGKTLECIILLAAYIPLRSYAGGHHSSSSEKCYIVSSFIMIIWMSLLKFQIIPTSCCVIMFIAGLVVCIMLAPVEDKNKPLDEDEIRVYRKRSYIVLAIESCVWILLSFVYQGVDNTVPLVLFTEAVMLISGKIKNSTLVAEKNIKDKKQYTDLSLKP